MSFDIMKMRYDDLAGKPKTLQSLTGLNPMSFPFYWRALSGPGKSPWHLAQLAKQTGEEGTSYGLS